MKRETAALNQKHKGCRMPIDRHNLMENLVSAWDKALGQRARADKNQAGARNKARSRIWVCAVGDRFRANYPEPDQVFWKGNPQEVLFDIMVCSMDTVESLQRHPQPLKFIAHCHWQVESEFDNTRELVIDMSKLVAGSADHKLMIAAHRKTADQTQILLNRCAKIADCCEGHVYFCFVAHPDEWDSSPQGPVLYEYIERNWRELR